MPGTTPDYWQAADDRIAATMLDLLTTRAARTRAAHRPRKG